VPCCPTDALPEDQSCCHCDKDTGGCINSSPAGKRRIAIGAEQQFGDDGTFGNNDESKGALANVGSLYTTITAIAVAACLLIVTVFVIIFATLQRNSYRSHTNVKYNKLSKGKRSSGSATTTLAIPSGDDYGDLEPMMASTLNFSDDEDDEQNGNGITFYANTWEKFNSLGEIK